MQAEGRGAVTAQARGWFCVVGARARPHSSAPAVPPPCCSLTGAVDTNSSPLKSCWTGNCPLLAAHGTTASQMFPLARARATVTCVTASEAPALTFGSDWPCLVTQPPPCPHLSIHPGAGGIWGTAISSFALMLDPVRTLLGQGCCRLAHPPHDGHCAAVTCLRRVPFKGPSPPP